MTESEHLIADIPQKAFIVHEGKVLFTLDKKGKLEPPGGRLHIGEEPEEGLRREIREELNLEIESHHFLHSFVFVSNSGTQHFVVVYICSAVDFSTLKVNEEELGGIQWLGPNDFESLNMREGYKVALRKFFAR